MGYASDQMEDDVDRCDADNEDNGDDPKSPADNEPTSARGIERTLNGTGQATDSSAETITIQETSTFGATERKQHGVALEAAVPWLKWQKHETLVRLQRQGYRNRLHCDRINSLLAIKKKLNTKQSPFEGGQNGLQALQACAIHGYLHMLTQNGCGWIDALECAAEAQGFASRWGGQQVCAWAESWVNRRELPVSQRGKHVKIFTLLEDPEIWAELQSYVHSNKWAIDPAKLTDFMAQKMVPAVAKAYGTNLMEKEIPTGLKRYLELEIFPHMHMKATQGVSLCTAWCWLH